MLGDAAVIVAEVAAIEEQERVASPVTSNEEADEYMPCQSDSFSSTDAMASLGAKYDLRMSTFRAQLDSSGKVSALLEQRFAPSFAFLVSGEIDHFKVCYVIHD